MHVPEIIEVKDHLAKLKESGVIREWELPYENILTRRSAAIFFATPKQEGDPNELAEQLTKYSNFSIRENTEKKLSQLKWRITFSQEEKEKNEKQSVEASK